MKWRIVANGAALMVTISIGATIAGGSPERSNASGMLRVGGGSAIGLLQNIRVENERGAGYVRALFEHWRDIDGDGCDSREQVLKRDSVTLPQVDPYKCKVVAGDWISPYDGARWSSPTDVDIDHVVALKEAWDSGAWAWSSATRKAYANDTSDKRTLLAVTDNVNQQKSDKDPSNWVPPLKSNLCTYLGNWISVKARWNLSMDQRLAQLIVRRVSDCAVVRSTTDGHDAYVASRDFADCELACGDVTDCDTACRNVTSRDFNGVSNKRGRCSDK